MKQADRDLALIDAIIADYGKLKSRLSRYSITEDSFKNDYSEAGEDAFDLVMTPVYCIAEDAVHLSNELMDNLPDYCWDDIRGFRNFVAHGYRNIDRDIAWGVVHKDIPELARLLTKYKEKSEER